MDYTANLQELASTVESVYSQLKVNTQVIHHMEIVNKIPIYGYHPETVRFIQVFLYNADLVKPLAEMFYLGSFGVVLQPYEAHIDVFQHFYCQLNVSGLEWLRVSDIIYRRPCDVPNVHTSDLPRITCSHLEADTLRE